MRKRIPSVIFPAVATLLFATGCMVPAYRLPHGFSSSYHRQLYGMEPVVIGGIPEDQIPLNTAPGVFFPEAIELQHPPSAVPTPDPVSQPVPRMMLPPQPSAKSTSSKR